MSQRDDGTLSRADFTFDKDRNAYICPKGKLLTTTDRVHEGRTIVYRASTRDCCLCPIKSKCTPNMTFRKIPRDVHEDARDYARALMGTPEFDKSRDERQEGRDALCTPEDPSPFRANASVRPLRCTGRIPPRGHRPKPKDTRQPSLVSAARHTGRIVCVSDSPERWSLSQSCRRSLQKGQGYKRRPLLKSSTSSTASTLQRHWHCLQRPQGSSN
jgi:Transposase DDE domain